MSGHESIRSHRLEHGHCQEVSNASPLAVEKPAACLAACAARL